MSVVRSWRRALLGASGVTLLVPAGLVGAVLLAATIGGTGGLDAVGQLVAGPQLPAAARPREAAAIHADDAGPAVPVRPRHRVRAPATTAARVRAVSPVTPRRSETRRPTAAPQETASLRPSGGRGRPGAALTPAKGTGSQSSSPGTTPAPPAAPPAKPETNPVRRIGAAVQKTVAPLPVVGPPASDAVGTVIDLIAPPTGGASRAASATSAPAPTPAPAPAAPTPAAPVTTVVKAVATAPAPAAGTPAATAPPTP